MDDETRGSNSLIKPGPRIKDSGDRTKFSTGAVRDMQVGKGCPSLFPVLSLNELAKHFEAGAIKYGRGNWKKGILLSSYLDSAFRHWAKIIQCEKDEDHISALAWNALCLKETIIMIEKGLLPKELDDIGYFNEGLSPSKL